MTTSLFLAMVALLAPRAEPPVPSRFTISSPSQTARSVLLAWETDQKVRTLKASTRWNPSTPTGPSHCAVIAKADGRQGSACAKVEGQPAGEKGRACWMQDLGELRPGAYQFHLFYRTSGQAPQGRARVVIDCYLGEARKYHGLISRDLGPAESWSEVVGSFELPPDARITRILLYQVGAGKAWFDDVRLLAAGSQANLVADGTFDGRSSFRVFWRKAGQAAWQPVEAVVLERFHNVIFLEPETSYEFKVDRVSAARRIEAESQTLTVAHPARSRSSVAGPALGPRRSHANAAGRVSLHRKPGRQAVLRRKPGRVAVAERARRGAEGALDQGVGKAVSGRRPAVLPRAEPGGRAGRQTLYLLEAGLSRRRTARTPVRGFLRPGDRRDRQAAGNRARPAGRQHLERRDCRHRRPALGELLSLAPGGRTERTLHHHGHRPASGL